MSQSIGGCLLTPFSSFHIEPQNYIYQLSAKRLCRKRELEGDNYVTAITFSFRETRAQVLKRTNNWSYNRLHKTIFLLSLLDRIHNPLDLRHGSSSLNIVHTTTLLINLLAPFSSICGRIEPQDCIYQFVSEASLP